MVDGGSSIDLNTIHCHGDYETKKNKPLWLILYEIECPNSKEHWNSTVTLLKKSSV